MKQTRCLICRIVILCCLLCAAGLPARAEEACSVYETYYDLPGAFTLTGEPAVSSDYAILLDADTGAILYGKQELEAAYPASTTKILTALLTVENVKDTEAVLTFSYKATHELEAGSSTIARTEGEQMTVSDCLYALMVASANEVAQGLAEYVSGSMDAFAELMNRRAAELGCVNSHFTNPSGLTDEEHYTCALDLAIIMREAVKNQELLTIMGTTSYQIAPTNKHSEITYMSSHHPLLVKSYETYYEYALAGKTGYTSAAQNTLVTYAEKDGRRLICVVMHGNGTSVVGTDSRSLLEYGFNSFVNTDPDAALQTEAAERSGSSFLSGDLLEFSGESGSLLTLPKGYSASELSLETLYAEGDTQAAAVRVFRYNGVTVGRIPLSVKWPEGQMPVEAVAHVAPTREQRLSTRYLWVPLRIWIWIGTGLVSLAVLGSLTAAIVNGIRRRRKKQAQIYRRLNEYH